MKDELKQETTGFTTSRRDFLKGAGAVALGMGMMPVLTLLGCESKAADVQKAADAAADAAAARGTKSFDEYDASANDEVLKSDKLMLEVLTESEVKEDLKLPDGKVIPALYLRLRNRINRLGRGIGSIPSANSWDLIMDLWSEEDAKHYLEMPLHQLFTAHNYAVESGRTEEECLKILEDQADRCLIWRVRRSGVAYFSLMPYINGFWEFGELRRHFEGTTEDVIKFDTLGVTGVDPNGGTGGYDTTFPLFRSLPISSDVTEDKKLLPYQDWKGIIMRNPLITVSPCQCRTMWQALGVPYPENHPFETCLSLGEMAEYFIENRIGRQVTQQEAIDIIQGAIDQGMVVESIASKNVDIICCCHSQSCGNLMGFRATNGEAASTKFFSAYNLKFDASKCIKCGKCIDVCPMKSCAVGSDGNITIDKACVRCGQCVPACPAGARVLTPIPDYPELPLDYLECNKYFAKDRMRRGQLVDFTDNKLPE